VSDLRRKFLLARRWGYNTECRIERIEHNELQESAVHIGCVFDLDELRRHFAVVEPDEPEIRFRKGWASFGTTNGIASCSSFNLPSPSGVSRAGAGILRWILYADFGSDL
jgi:hypothetical protein